ncbi:DUF4209 domain-containing protein [Lactovum odontotermitis]
MKWLEKILESTEHLHFELIAQEVYSDLVKVIADDETIIDYQNKRAALEKRLIERFDESDDDFVRLIIGHSLISGIYYIHAGLSQNNEIEKYHGTRFNEFREQTFNLSTTLGKTLIESKKQYRIAFNLFCIAVNSSSRSEKNQLREYLFELVNLFEASDIKENVSALEFLVPSISYLIDDKKYRTENLLLKMNSLIEAAVSFGDTAPTVRSQYNAMGFDKVFPQTFELKIKYFQKKQDKANVKLTAKEYASVYEELARRRYESGGASIRVAKNHLEAAVQIYLSYDLANSPELKSAKATLDNIKTELHNGSDPDSKVYAKNIMNYFSKEERGQLDAIICDFKSKDLNYQILFLLQAIHFISEEDVQKARQQNKKSNQFYEIFPLVFTNEDGQTIFENKSEENKVSLALFDHIQMTGVVWIHLLQAMWEEKYSIDFSDLVSKNETLKPRAYFINEAFRLFFEGEVYSAIYLLIPQIEWWFRKIASNEGDLTSNLKNFPVEQSKTLAPLLDTDSVKEFLGENNHWLFKELMTMEPMNIRNKAAHGLEFNDNGYCAYFVLCVMKLIMSK